MKRLAVLILFFSAPAAKAGPAGDAMPFLKVDAGARGAAMSGAYSALGDDALSVFYNPAGTALLDRKELLLGHTEWLDGIRNELLAYAQPLGPGLTAFAGVNALLSGSMARYDAAGVPDGSFSALEAAVSAGVSADLGDGFYGAAALKELSQQAAGYKTSAFAADAGLLKRLGNWSIGAAAANYGSRLKLGSAGFDLPRILRAGVAYTYLDNYTLAAEAVKAGSSDATAAVGVEAKLNTGPGEYFFLRTGYKTGRSSYAGSGVTAGAGVSGGAFRLDYAYAPYGELGDTHRVTLSVRFGAERQAELSRSTYYRLPPPRSKPERSSGNVKKKGERPQPGEVYFMW